MSHKSKSHPVTPVPVTATRSLHLYGLELTFEATSVFESTEQVVIVDVIIDDVEIPMASLRVTRVNVDGVESTGSNLLCSDDFMGDLRAVIHDELDSVRRSLS